MQKIDGTPVLFLLQSVTFLVATESVIVSSVPKLDLGLEQAKIAAVRQEWLQAVRDGNADRLGDLTTDGVVAVLKDGRCVNGKEALRTTLQHIFSLYDVERRTLASDVIVRDNWAIALDELDNAVTSVSSGMEVQAHVKAVIVYARQSNGDWKVARLMELLD